MTSNENLLIRSTILDLAPQVLSYLRHADTVFWIETNLVHLTFRVQSTQVPKRPEDHI